MKTYTLGFLFRSGKIILAIKKRKIGIGKFNGYGGRVEGEENKSESLVREIKEECEVVVEKEKCKELGWIDFHFKGKDDLNQKVYIFRVDEFSGEPKETQEMGKPEEFDVDKIPYDKMMVGDDKFIPFVVQGKKFKGEIYFSENGETIVKCVLSEIVNENNEIKMK